MLRATSSMRKRALAAFALALVVAVIRNMIDPTPLEWGIWAGVIVAVFVPLLLYVFRLRAVLTYAEVGKAGPLGVLRMHARTEVGWVLHAVYPPTPFNDNKHVQNFWVLDRYNKVLFRLQDNMFSLDEIHRFLHYLGAPVNGPQQIITPKELDAVQPGVVRLSERRPVLVMLMTIGIVFLVAIIAVIVAVALSSS